MRKGRYEKSSHKNLWFVMLCIIFAGVLIITLLYFSCSQDQSTSAPKETISAVQINPDSIAIPGYEGLELKARSTKQTVCFPNPSQNMCYFQISLFLEDGTLLWKSDLIEPGKTSKPIVLAKALDRGTYRNAVLRYACFRMDEDLAPLNGAETKVTLWVK